MAAAKSLQHFAPRQMPKTTDVVNTGFACCCHQASACYTSIRKFTGSWREISRHAKNKLYSSTKLTNIGHPFVCLKSLKLSGTGPECERSNCQYDFRFFFFFLRTDGTNEVKVIAGDDLNAFAALGQ